MIIAGFTKTRLRFRPVGFEDGFHLLNDFWKLMVKIGGLPQIRLQIVKTGQAARLL